MILTNTYTRVNARLPKSRNFLLGVSLSGMSWPLRKAFDILHLTEKKDDLTANQVASAFQANEKILQERTGRTSVDLIRDLNEFVQYE